MHRNAEAPAVIHQHPGARAAGMHNGAGAPVKVIHRVTAIR
jgi:hypothetical protein